MIGDKKDALFRDNPNPAILDRKFFSEKAYYVPGFEPSSFWLRILLPDPGLKDRLASINGRLIASGLWRPPWLPGDRSNPQVTPSLTF